jgi:hypothetical protein
MARKSATRAEIPMAAAKRVATPVNVVLRSVSGSNSSDRPSEAAVSKWLLKEAEEEKGSDLVSREEVSGAIDLLRNEPDGS